MTSRYGRSSSSPDGVVEGVYRAEWGRLLSLLVSRTRRIDLVEDALSEAFARAAQHWSRDEPPDNPAGWLYATAYRQVVGKLRAEAIAGRKAPLLAVAHEWTPAHEAQRELGDDRLELILLCCHPALPTDSRSALALRFVIGTSTDQIARLFLVPTATMAARLTRAKKKIAVAGIPLAAPRDEELTARLDEVCRTIYLAFTAGYTPGSGPDLLRADLAGDALRLAAVLHELVPDAPQVRAMLALLLLQHARRDARVQGGQLVTLADQDRSLWRRDETRAGLALLSSFPAADGYGEELRLQALIAAEHARAETASATDWSAIAALYAALEDRTGSPVVRLNRAVAVAEAQSPHDGLLLTVGLEDTLPNNHRVHAVRAELAQRAGDTDLARRAYLRAIDLCSNDIEIAHLRSRLDALN
jgi:RNA polymerase sigma-70 factor (ECF subfamily)